MPTSALPPVQKKTMIRKGWWYREHSCPHEGRRVLTQCVERDKYIYVCIDHLCFELARLISHQIQTVSFSLSPIRWQRHPARKSIISDRCDTLRHAVTSAKNGYQLIPRRNTGKSFWRGAVLTEFVARQPLPSCRSTWSLGGACFF